MSSLVFLLLISSLVDGVFGESVSVMKGDSVILHTDITDIKSVIKIMWQFEETRIAQLDTKINKISIYNDTLNERFRGRLQLDDQTGDLTITNISTEHTGAYKLQIFSTSGSPSKTFNVNVIDGKSGGMKTVSVPMGESVILNTDKQTYDPIKWTFKADSLIAEINRAAQKFFTYDGPDGRFRGRLTLDHQTGSLNIRNIRTEHTGLYQAEIKSSSHTILKIFSVTVSDVKTESVMEGESVTLHTDLTDVQRDDHILWIFETEYSIIAEINRETNTSTTHDGPDERFRDRLQLNDQTGSLTITHIRSTDSGLYKLEMKSSRHTIHKRFTVTLTASGLSPGQVAAIVVGVLLLVAAVVGAVVVMYLLRDKWITITVEEGRSVTLNTNVIKQNNQQIKWFVGKNTLIAELNEADKISIYDDVLNGRFKHRLQLDPQTGSLIITDTRHTDEELYKLQISDINTGKKIIKTFRVIVCELKKLRVMEGESVTLNTDDIKIQRDDVIQWRFGDEETLIAQFNRADNKTLLNDGPDGRFRGRLKSDDLTGSLTITNIRHRQSGVYHLKIISSGAVTSYSRFMITVIDEEKRDVMTGDSIILKYYDPEIQTADEILWTAEPGDTIIAQYKRNTQEPLYTSDERFRDRLKLNHQTGSLTITESRITDSGLYTLKIRSSDVVTSLMRFSVFVGGEMREMNVMEGDSVTLNPDVHNLQDGDKILWYHHLFFRKPCIAEISRGDVNSRMYDNDKIFRDRLNLDHQTGSLTITNTTESGEYQLLIISKNCSCKTFKVSVIGEEKTDVMTGDSVTLVSNDHRIQTADEILWTAEPGDTIIAQYKRNTQEPLYTSDERFRDRLKLNHQTGSLTITESRITDSGLYTLKIRSSGVVTLLKRFCIFVIGEMREMNVMEGDSITLNPDDHNLQDGDKILWYYCSYFDNTCIAKVTIGDVKSRMHDAGTYRERLNLDHETGSLTIKNISADHSREYRLLIIGQNCSCKIFIVDVGDKVSVSAKEEEPFTLETDITDTKRYNLMTWFFKGDRVAAICKSRQASDWVDEKYRERIQVDQQTGSLIVRNSRTTDSGEYKLKIRIYNKTSVKIFSVTVSGLPQPLVSAQPALKAPPPASDSRNESTVIHMPEKTPDGRNESDPLLNDNQEVMSSV